MPTPSSAQLTRETTRLYLVVPAYRQADELNTVLDAGDVACVLLLTDDLDETTLRRAIDRLRPPAQAHDVAFLLQDQVELAAETGCDGVHLIDPKDYRAARERIGEGMIVGVSCGASPHDPMVVADHGADYVAFGALGAAGPTADPELLGWWQQVMTVPCVAFEAKGPEDCAQLAAAGADFVAVGAAVWADPEGPIDGLRACAAAITKDGMGA